MDKRKTLALVLLFFGTIYCLISLVNHYQFRTFALDLGMFNHAIYSFAHFKQNYFTLDISGAEINYFGDHFAPITVLLSPFYYFFGSYTLLIIQIIAILFGGVGIYKYASLYFSNKHLLLILFVIHFLSIWGIYSALMYDFHTNVLAAMIIPWLVYYYEKNNKWLFFVLCLLVLIAKENMALWMIFILLGLMVRKYGFNIKQAWQFEIPLLIFSFLYFVIIIGFVMPHISQGLGTNQLARYGHLGATIPEILFSIVTKPSEIFTMLFKNTSPDDSMLYGIKSELHFMVLVSGGILLFFSPSYILFLIPIYAQKLLTNDFVFWGINGQYSIEFVPVLSLCAIDTLRKLKNESFVLLLALLTTCSTIYFSFKKIESRKSLWYNKENLTFFTREHYHSDLNLSAIYSALEKVPKNAIISVSSELAPHLAFRDKIYHFPVIKDASHVVVFTSKKQTYPLSEDDFKAQIKNLKTSKEYVVVYDENDLLILERINASKVDSP